MIVARGLPAFGSDDTCGVARIFRGDSVPPDFPLGDPRGNMQAALLGRDVPPFRLCCRVRDGQLQLCVVGV